MFHSDTKASGAVFHSDTRVRGAVFHSDTRVRCAVCHCDTKPPGAVFHCDTKVYGAVSQSDTKVPNLKKSDLYMKIDQASILEIEPIIALFSVIILIALLMYVGRYA